MARLSRTGPPAWVAAAAAIHGRCLQLVTQASIPVASVPCTMPIRSSIVLLVIALHDCLGQDGMRCRSGGEAIHPAGWCGLDSMTVECAGRGRLAFVMGRAVGRYQLADGPAESAVRYRCRRRRCCFRPSR